MWAKGILCFGHMIIFMLLNVIECQKDVNKFENEDYITKMFTVKSYNASIKSLFSHIYDDVHFIDNYTAKIIGRSAELKKIKNHGLEVVSVQKGQPFSQLPPSGYHSPNELLTLFKQLQTNYPTRALIVDLTASYRTPTTLEGRRIYALKISDNVSLDEKEPNILLVSGHHCRELITPHIALNTSRHLLENYERDSTIRSMINDNQIYVVWDQNPDGSAYVWSRDNYWRKNRRLNYDGSFGVDLNRNYPIGWEFSCSGSLDPASETYKGLYPGSEAETQTMLIFHEDRRFSRVLDFHSYSEDVRTIYGDCASLPAAIDEYFISIAQNIAKQMGYSQVRSCCMGGNIHSAYNYHGSLSYLFETGQDFQPPQKEMERVLARVLPGTLYFLSLPIPLSGTIKDSTTNTPIEAYLEIQELSFNLQETKRSNPNNGLYHLWLPNGTWTVRVIAEGYSPQSLQVEINSRGLIRDFYLSKKNN